MSRIKRDFSEKMLSSHHYFEALEQRSAGAMVNGWDVFFQAFFNTPALPYSAIETFINPDTVALGQFLAGVSNN